MLESLKRLFHSKPCAICNKKPIQPQNYIDDQGGMFSYADNAQLMQSAVL